MTQRRYSGTPEPRRKAMPIMIALGVVLALGVGIAALTLGRQSPATSSATSTPASSQTLGAVGTKAGGSSARGATPSAPSAGGSGSPRIAPSGAPSASNQPSASPPPPPVAGRFGAGILIADRGNGRLLIVNEAKKILWSFPRPGNLPKGQQFAADDAFLSPDGKSIVANDEGHEVIDRIDIATGKVVWQYGRYNTPGSALDRLHTPDDAYPLANGDIVVADIGNCRILQITPDKRVARQWGRAGNCTHHPPTTFGSPNGDTPLADGGLLITEITGSRVVRLDRHGKVVFDVRAPVIYPSDAQLDASGNIVVVDYSRVGAVVAIRPDGHLLWRYAPKSGAGRLDHPSLAVPLADGTIVLNDDFRHRVIVIDPRTKQIVWQYGRTDRPGTGPGSLNTPDGVCLIPLGTVLPPA